MDCRLATAADAGLLAAFNQQLIRDEGHRNSMNLAELTERMSGWLKGEYQAAMFELEGTAVGYALFRSEPEYIYIRQLFVTAEHRRKGIARTAIAWLRKNRWSDTDRLRIDVLVGNSAAREFWKSVGFRDYCITMESENRLETS